MKEENCNYPRQYILLTVAKDEEKNLPNLIQSVLTQTLKPLVWVIVDDGSTDDTPNILREIKKKYNWIQIIQLGKNPRDVGKHYARICNIGFDLAIKYCETNNLQYDYIGIVDADMTFGTEFFDKLIREFEKNPKLGIASGSVYSNIHNKLISEDCREDLPMGSPRLWRRECFEEDGGYYISHFPDSVSNVSATLKGWETKIFKDLKAIQARRTHSAEGLWHGYKIIGKSDYFRGYHPLFMVAKVIGTLCKWPCYMGIAYFWGYFGSVLRREDKIDNVEIKNYYRNKHREVVQYYWSRLKNKLN